MPQNSAFVCNSDAKIISILCSGSDDRSTLKGADSVNKYYTRPDPYAVGSLFRGSCTCNFPTVGGYNAALQAFTMLENNLLTVEDLANDIRKRLKHALKTPDGTEIVLMPSGSDAEYIPVVIAKLLFPGRKIVNVVTCNGEVGSGTLDGAGGKYFSVMVPIPAALDESVNAHDPVPELSDNVEAIGINARMENSEILDTRPKIEEILAKCDEDNSVAILHSVLGSKTGICEPERHESQDILRVIDACQGRFEISELEKLLNAGNILLFTASKFYRAPPFCGCVLIPKNIMDELRNVKDVSIPKGLRTFVTTHEVPVALDSWKAFLSDEENQGLVLRWLAGLYEIEETVKISYSDRAECELKWRKTVVDVIEECENMELLENSFDTYTIVSVKLRENTASPWFSKTELTDIYKWMTLDLSKATKALNLNGDSSILKKRVYIGQPVAVGRNLAIVRVAADSEFLRNLHSDQSLLAEDVLVLQKLKVLSENFSEIRKVI